jgi:DAK2 domain fusion protein YloV
VTTLDHLGAADLRAVVEAYNDALAAHREPINRLNVYPVPDGDTGTNMSLTLGSVCDELCGAEDDLAAVCKAISHGSLMGARGNSGVILSQVLRGFVGVVAESGGLDGPGFAQALRAASDAAYQAVMRPVEGTILTVVRESAEASAQALSANPEADLVNVLVAAHERAERALARTPELLPVLAEAGVVDAGGTGYLLLLDALLHVVDGRPVPVPRVGEGALRADARLVHVAADEHGDGSSDLRYEVMYFLEAPDEAIPAFKDVWAGMGDSIVVVGGDGIWNCHIHTNDIGAAIEVAIEVGGRPKQIRVTDLFEEVAEEHAHRTAGMATATMSVGSMNTSSMNTGGTSTAAPTDSVPTRPGGGLPPVTCAVVAVCSGEGLVELFSNLGVQGVVTGGQTMNPSTAELLDTVEHVNADQVVILPNNKNIIPVAEQVGALTSKTVVVVPTRSMPEALAALIVYDPEASGAENGAEMTEAAGSVTTGEVTKAVRDANSEIGPIRQGDWIGLVRDDGIAAVAADVDGAATALLDQLVAPGHELVTVITGVDATPSATATIEGWLADQRADVQVEVHRGGQPLYPYLFGVE